MNKTKLGTELSVAEQKEVLARYIYRCTFENHQRFPNLVRQARGMLRLLTDAEWLACTQFYVTKSGRLDRRMSSCRTYHPDFCPATRFSPNI